MKKLLLLISGLILNIIVIGQSYHLGWQNCFGGSKIEWAEDICLFNNCYYLLGGTESNDGDVSFIHGSNDIWLIKTDLSGNLIWEKTYGGSGSESGCKVIPTLDGNLYILGTTWSSDGDISNNPNEALVIWVLKIDPDGNILWERTFGGSEREYCTGGTLTSDGGVVVCGYGNSDDGDVSVNYGYYDMWVFKLNSQGELIWETVIGNEDIDYSFSVIETIDKGFLVSGSSFLYQGGNLSCIDHGTKADGVLAKLDSFGNLEWTQCYGGSDYDNINMIIEVDNGYIFAGAVTSNDGQITGAHGEEDIWVVKTDFLGNILWDKILGGSLSDVPAKLYIDNSGDIIVFGQTQSKNGDVIGKHGEFKNWDIWVIRLSPDGNILSQQCIGGLADERLGTGVVKRAEGHYVIAAEACEKSFDVQCTKPFTTIYDNIWAFELKDCSYYKTSRPEGDTRVCVNLQPTSEYVTHPYFDANGYLWVIDPAEAGVASNTDSITTITWNPNFEGTAKLSVRLDTECGIIQPSDTLEVEVHRDCTGVEDLAMQAIKLYFQPNPANENSVLHYTLPVSENRARLELYDLSGQMVYSAELRQHEGTHIIPTANLKGGVYMCSIVSGREKGVGRLVVVK
ncbi:MAG: T9SS type A sorting domain-containing protein [Sphingobacteriia bacterium]|nr:T9SS type A sorting domain-containing protein [Sphingobacteriia bacterium]